MAVAEGSCSGLVRMLLGAALMLVASGCSGRSEAPTQAPFVITAVVPGDGLGGANGKPAVVPLRLNQEITISFTAPVDPLTVGPGTVRMLDEAGDLVPGRLECGAGWITFHPVVPTRPDLSDGSFRPGGAYRLHVVGYPRRNAVRALDGRVLRDSLQLDFQVADDDPADLFVAGPVDQPFQLLLPYLTAPSFAAGNPLVTLQYSMPVQPTTVRPSGFEVLVLRAFRDQPEEAPLPVTARVLPEEPVGLPVDLLAGPGSTVELRLAPPPSGPFQPGDVVYIRPHPDRPVRDYAGRPASVDSSLQVPWQVVDGDGVAAMRWFQKPGHLRGDSPGSPGMVVDSAGWVRPGCFVEMGEGGAHVLVEPGEERLIQGAELSADSFRVAEGAQVRWEGPTDQSVTLRVRGDVVVDGTLILATRGAVSRLEPAGVYGETELAASAGLVLYCGGALRIGPKGRLLLQREEQAPPALVAYGGVVLLGELPAGTILGQVGRGRLLIQGSASDPVLVRANLRPGVVGTPPLVTAWTGWQPIPESQGQSFRVAWTEVGGGAVTLEYQQAPPDPIRPWLPADVRLARPEPVGQGESIGLNPGHHLRFRIRMETLGGARGLPGMRDLRMISSGR